MDDYDVRGALDLPSVDFPVTSVARVARERAILVIAIVLAVLGGTGLSVWAELQTHLRPPSAARSCVHAHGSRSLARTGCRP
jgi:hypothetical protein